MKNNLIELAKESLYLKNADAKTQNANYKKHFEKTNKFSFFVNNFVEKNESVQLADTFIEKFSEKKQVNGYKTTFDLDALMFKNCEKDFERNGSIKFHFEIISQKGLRGIANRELFNFWVDEENKEMLFMYHGSSPSEKNMNVLHVKFDEMLVVVGDKNTYEKKVGSKIKPN